MTWQKYPVIHEINTWVWLSELSRTVDLEPWGYHVFIVSIRT